MNPTEIREAVLKELKNPQPIWTLPEVYEAIDLAISKAQAEYENGEHQHWTDDKSGLTWCQKCYELGKDEGFEAGRQAERDVYNSPESWSKEKKEASLAMLDKIEKIIKERMKELGYSEFQVTPIPDKPSLDWAGCYELNIQINEIARLREELK